MSTPQTASSAPSPGRSTPGAASPASSFPRPSSPNLQPPAIHDHELLRRIGGGSYGEVWLARSVMGSYRAVKIVHRHNFEHDRPFEREFAGIQKFEPISRSHEGVVDLLQVGRNEQEGYFYYVMELADDANGEIETRIAEGIARPHPGPLPQGEGETSSARQEVGTPPNFDRRATAISSPGGEGQGEGGPKLLCNSAILDPLTYCPKTLRSLLRPDPQPSTTNPQPNSRLPLEECIQLGLSLTNALAYLHEQGLVHRDIKPSNIIFVGGVPKLADVGLVTGVDEAHSYVGTEGFIPPEGPGSPQADLYSLGILLYQMSTGKSHQDFPEPLADLAAQPDHARWLEFNAVIHKACAASPRERYQNAEEMRHELGLLQRGESVKNQRASRRRLGFAWKTTIAVTAIAVSAAVGWQIYSGIALRRLSAPISRPVVSPREMKVLAVLPFDNENEDEADRELAARMTEDLTRALSRIPAVLRVLGRDSAAGLKNAPDRRIAAQLSEVTAMLDVRVRKSGNQIQLTAQLINPADGRVLWSKSDACAGEAKDLRNLRNRLAEGVVRVLTGGLAATDRTLLVINETQNAEAHKRYLRARGMSNDAGIPGPENQSQAKALFQEAINLDPQFAAAYAGLAGCFLVESQTHSSPKDLILKALAAAEKALEFDDTLAEAHEALARTKYRLYDWESARREFELAIRLDPYLASARKHYADYLKSQGRFEDAIEQSRRAAETDPGSIFLGMSLGWTLFDARRYDQAQKTFEAALKSAQNPEGASDGLAWCHLAQGHHAEAVAQWTRQWQTSTKEAALLQVYRKEGMQGYWRRTLEQSLEQLSRGEYVDPYWLAADYAKVGDNDHAFEWLERAYEQHNALMPLVALEYQFNSLHSDPRFAALLGKLGLPMPID